MGCFSFLCKKCGKGIQSTSFSGHQCHLFLLKEGEVIQKMSGEYDSYGRVFIEESQSKKVKHSLRESEYWKDPTPEIPLDEYWAKKDKTPDNQGYWIRVCNLMQCGGNNNGIAAYHDKCYNGETPTTKSEDDPNQGWGEDGEDFGDCSMKYNEGES